MNFSESTNSFLDKALFAEFNNGENRFFEDYIEIIKSAKELGRLERAMEFCGDMETIGMLEDYRKQLQALKMEIVASCIGDFTDQTEIITSKN